MYCNLQEIWNLSDFGVHETSHSEITTRKNANSGVWALGSELWALGTLWSSLGALWELSASSLGALWELSGSSLGALWGLSGSSLGAWGPIDRFDHRRCILYCNLQQKWNLSVFGGHETSIFENPTVKTQRKRNDRAQNMHFSQSDFQNSMFYVSESVDAELDHSVAPFTALLHKRENPIVQALFGELYEYMSTWVYEIWIFEYMTEFMNIRVYKYTSIWVYEYRNVWVNEYTSIWWVY